MSHIPLTPAQRKAHRAAAHHLEPVVFVGSDGLTDAVMREVDAALSAHGLIKIRVFSDDRLAREAMLGQLADALNAAAIQHIGKLLVLWRPPPDKPKAADPARGKAPREFKVLKFSSKGGHKPEVKVVKVLGNQRLTPGGLVKRAKPRRTSIKKLAT